MYIKLLLTDKLSFNRKGNTMSLVHRAIEFFMRPRWIVNISGELGFRIFGINFWYYKWPDPIIGTSDDSTFWRIMKKREFGEVIKNHNHEE